MMEVVPAFILISSGYFFFSFLFIFHGNREILEIKGSMQLLQSYHFLSLLLLKFRLHLLWLSGKESAYKQEIKETRVEALVWEDPLEEDMAILSSIFAWKIPWTE